MHRQSLQLLLIAAVPLGLQTFAAELRVPEEYPTIQAGIDASVDGDVVRVSQGIYLENINFRGKAILVQSNDGPENTVIDGDNQDSVVTFESGEPATSELSGFTLQHGLPGSSHPSDGGGILIAGGASPTIRNNVISSNRACNGAGVAVGEGSPVLESNVIANNEAPLECVGGNGGGIYCLGSSAQIRNNLIYRNSADGTGGVELFGPRGVVLRNNLIAENTSRREGGGIAILNSEAAFIIQNVIVGNTASQIAGGVYLFAIPRVFVNNTIADNHIRSSYGASEMTIYSLYFVSDNILANNVFASRSDAPTVGVQNRPSGRPTFITNNDFWNAIGPAYSEFWPDLTGEFGNISSDPQFVGPNNSDYHLQGGSLCIDTGRNDVPYLEDTDFDGNPRIVDGSGRGTAIIDLGAYEFPGIAKPRAGLQQWSGR